PIMAQHGAETLLHDRRCEQLSERRGDRFEPRLRATEAHVAVHREANAREEPALRQQVFPAHAHRVAEAQPRLDPPLLSGAAVVVDDPLDPGAADVRFGTVGEDQGVLDRDVDLIIEAVGNPELQLVARQLTVVHTAVEGMKVVIALLEHVAELADEFVTRPGAGVGTDPRRRRRHSSTSMPSSATSIPAPSTWARSLEERLRMGFVLLMCTSTVRLAPRRGSSSMPPPGPPTGRCPISRAVGASAPAPAARSSPSAQKVPSNSSRSPPRATDRTASSTAPAVGT